MDEYPTGEELKTIKEWDLAEKKVEDLLEYIEEIWWAPERGFILSGKRVKKLELHTSGWSGNEDIIGALQRNILFFALYWEKSVKGGHYYFKIMPIKKSGR